MDELRHPANSQQPTPSDILKRCYEDAATDLERRRVEDTRVDEICQCDTNRSITRFLLSCLLAKTHQPRVDIRKPYTEIGGTDCYSGRSYDEEFVSEFIVRHNLPLNSTTAFLTPAFRTKNQPIDANAILVGKPKQAYAALVSLLQDVQEGRIAAESCLTEVIRQLVSMRDSRRESIERLFASAQTRTGELSAQQIVEIVHQHLRQPRGSRLPVLVVSAVYEVIADMTGKTPRDLSSHTAADMRTGALGDIEIVLPTQSHPYTVYEVKARPLRRNDIDTALQKLAQSSVPVAQYVFVVTGSIAEEISSYLEDINKKHIRTEFQIFDCIQMLDHFLHFFHEKRNEFLGKYMNLVMQDTAVNQELKEKLLELVRMVSTGT